ncbi:TlpA family protein disulfide reductase [candidate division WOR-3 bacterium]|nr:TlpA family protein disulfide reductase [candidate division WOR-3 bacterium]
MKRMLGLFVLVMIVTTCGSADQAQSGESKLTDFSLPALDGSQVKLSDYKGQVVIIDFWATWCPPCKNSIPTFIRLYDKYHGQGFTVLGIGLDDEAALRKFANEMTIPYPVLVGNNDIGKAYGVTGIPKTIFIDKKGKIRKTQVGYAPELEAQFDILVDSLLSE